MKERKTKKTLQLAEPSNDISEASANAIHEENSRIFYRLASVVNESMAVGGFEIRLQEKDIAWFLELYGVLPTIYNPIPCDANIKDEDQYDDWWAAHPKEEKKFRASIEKREEALRLLFAGVLLGQAFPNLLSSSDKDQQ